MVSFADGDTVLMGNNEDLAKDGYIWFVPGGRNRYARINVGLEPDFAQGSLNEKGLAFDAAVVPEIPMDHDRGRKADNLMERVMDTCATVDEALEVMREVRFRHYARSQFFLADATGASAIVTWHRTEDRLSVIRKEGPWQIATNCRMEDVDYREDRYIVGARVAEAAEAPSLDAVKRILQAMYGRMEAPEGYATIYDLKTLDVTLYNRYDFSRSKSFNLKEAIAGEAWSHKMDDLFEGVTYEKADGTRTFDVRIDLPEEARQQYVGQYRGSEGGIGTVALTENGLSFTNSEGQVVNLVPVGETRFAMAGTPAQILFHRDDSGNVTGMSAHVMEQPSQYAERVGE